MALAASMGELAFADDVDVEEGLVATSLPAHACKSVVLGVIRTHISSLVAQTLGAASVA